MFSPTFTITAKLAKLLMAIESHRQQMVDIPMTAGALTALRESARLVSAHYSTQIEGNRLTQAEVQEVIAGGTVPHRERDQREVHNYHLAQGYVEELCRQRDDSGAKLEESHIQTIHGLVMRGRATATPYREGQNVIKDSLSGGIVYMPPEAKDVPKLMKELVTWLAQHISSNETPIPIVAAIAHYQFATIHPYYDGNGRTGRLLTTLILHLTSYHLKGIFSLEEYYAQDLRGYYDALDIGSSHNYYFGREDADITSWLEYFCGGMAVSFQKVQETARKFGGDGEGATQVRHEDLLRRLDARQRAVLTLFQRQQRVTTREVAETLGIHIRTALKICTGWCETGFLVRHGTAPKSRHYTLGAEWLPLIGSPLL